MVWFNRIKKFYDAGLWTKSMVSDGVTAGKITEDQYFEITKEKYVEAY